MGRRSRRALVALGLAVGMAIVSVMSAGAASAGTTVGVWHFHEAAGASTARDSSGNAQHGAVGRQVETGVRIGTVTAYRFPTWDSPAADHNVIVPHNARLNPDSGSYAMTIRMRFGRDSSNVMQKGQSGTPGGYWKVAVSAGQVRCLFRTGTGTQVTVTSTTRLDNGAWQEVRCGRTGSTVSMYVNGKKHSSRTGLTGSISNTWELAIGGKSRCDGVKVGCDFFAGEVDYVRIEKG